MQAWFCSGVLPNPTPGSRRMRLNATPARAAMASERSKERSTSSRMSIDGSTDLAIVHDDDGRGRIRDGVRHSGIAPEPPDVVDDRGAEPGRLARHRRLAGVDRDRGVDLAPERLENRNNAPKLLFFGHRRMPGPGRFAANVHDRGALGDHGPGARDRGGWTSKCRPPSENESGVTLRMPISAGDRRNELRNPIAEDRPAAVGHGRFRRPRARPAPALTRPAPRGCAPRSGRPCGTTCVRISRWANGSGRLRGRSRRAGCPSAVRA